MYTELEWLPPPSPDFRAQAIDLLRDARETPGPDFATRLARLANAALDDAQLTRLAGVAGAILQSGRSLEGFVPAKVGLVGDATLSLLAAPIAGSAVRHGLLLEIVEGGYDSAVQDAMDTAGRLHAAGLDFLVVAPDARMLGLDQAAWNEEEAAARVQGAVDRLRAIIDGLRPAVAGAILVQTLAPPVEDLFGSLDRTLPGAPFSMIEAVNRRLAEWAAAGDIVLADIARLAGLVGLERWHDPGHWHASKLAFAPELIPLYADRIARTVAAARGASRKCLVLDLDNTLWGGVIGDDGVAGIRLGQGSAEGEAFLAVQRMALELRGRGIVLAVCSKNEEDAARLPFREHPDMLLREDHIAVFQANWTDKAANLRAIAEALNIGLDALVFLDDNPAERMQVRDALPQVAVPELPDDPAFYPRALAAAGYFETVTFSEEDRQRAGYYQANAQRAAALTATGDLGDYLASLDMTCVIAPVDPVSRPRVAQLINKSNQFNLTTRRYTEAEVEVAERDPARHAVQIRLTDRFGDNGIISVIIAHKDPAAWEIDTWLMSCRVLGRRVQEAALAHLAAAAAAEGASALVGRYKPSPKNRMVAQHYESLGFTQVDAQPDGETLWRLDLSGYSPPGLPMRVEDSAISHYCAAS